jgi:hypothetical protein
MKYLNNMTEEEFIFMLHLAVTAGYSSLQRDRLIRRLEMRLAARNARRAVEMSTKKKINKLEGE